MADKNKDDLTRAQGFIIYTVVSLFLLLAIAEILFPGYKISPLVGGIVGLVIGLAFGVQIYSHIKNGRG